MTCSSGTRKPSPADSVRPERDSEHESSQGKRNELESFGDDDTSKGMWTSVARNREDEDVLLPAEGREKEKDKRQREEAAGKQSAVAGTTLGD